MTPLLEATQLSVSLGGHPVLHEVSATLHAGQIIALIGPNGSGKTTLLRSAMGYVRGTGTVRWFGKTLADWGAKALAQQVAYMPQSPVYEPGDRVIDVLRLGRAPYHGWLGIETDTDDEVVLGVAADLELTDLLERRIETLSGGQRQRVFLGRCLAQSPKAVLLDEPATFLDLRHQVDLYRLLRRLAADRQIGVLMSSHDLNLAAAHADQAIVLRQGRLLASGPIGQVMTESVMTDAFDLPMKRVEIDGVVQLVAIG